MPQAPGLSGGYPAATQFDVLVRGADVLKTLNGGAVPRTLEELGGELQIVPPHIETDLDAADVYFTHWRGGRGLGDPVLREAEVRRCRRHRRNRL